MTSGVFVSFFSDSFCHFTIYDLCRLHLLILKRYISERIGLERSSFLKICTARLQMSMSQTFGVRKIVVQNLLAKVNRNAEMFCRKSSILTRISCDGCVC